MSLGENALPVRKATDEKILCLGEAGKSFGFRGELKDGNLCIQFIGWIFPMRSGQCSGLSGENTGSYWRYSQIYFYGDTIGTGY